MAFLKNEDIVNNLDTKRLDKPLSAMMGVTLKKLLDKSTKDTGWIDISSYLEATDDHAHNVENYYPDRPARIRRIGDIVFLDAELRKITGDQPSTLDPEYLLFVIPEGFRPSYDVVKVCQGSHMNRVTVHIFPNGNLYLCRYGTTDPMPIVRGTWLPIMVDWCI